MGLEKLLGIAQRKGTSIRHYNEGYHLSQIMNSAKIPVVKVDSHQNPKGTVDRAQFDILITRQTANIPDNLQVAIFGSMHSMSSYVNFVQPAAGGSFVVVGGRNSAAPNAMRFTHTVGAGVDIIDVTCNQIPYPTFLDATTNDIFKISNIRYQLVNPLNTIQFTQLFNFTSKTLFGKGQNNDVSVGAYKKPEQFQPGIIDIPISSIVDKETAILMNMSNLAVAYPFQVQLSIFVERFSKYDSNVIG